MSALPKREHGIHGLKYGIRHYPWGRTDRECRVASLHRNPSSPPPYAELWLGTHPALPSVLTTGVPLSDLLKGGGKDMPCLLKVLSVASPLSVQVHPDVGLAALLRAKDPESFPDANHKPELLMALSPFTAMVGLNPPSLIASFVGDYPLTLGAVLSPEGLEPSPSPASVFGRLARFAGTGREEGRLAIGNHVELLSRRGANGRLEDRIFLRLAERHPADAAVFMAYVLRCVKLEPGDAVYIGPNVPHCYVEGEGVEVMARGDNVVRVGLTGKRVDPETAAIMVQSPGADRVTRYPWKGNPVSPGTGPNAATVRNYEPADPDVTDFVLSSVRSDADRISITPSGPAMGLVLRGAGIGSAVFMLPGAEWEVSARESDLRCRDEGRIHVVIAQSRCVSPVKVQTKMG